MKRRADIPFVTSWCYDPILKRTNTKPKERKISNEFMTTQKLSQTECPQSTTSRITSGGNLKVPPLPPTTVVDNTPKIPATKRDPTPPRRISLETLLLPPVENPYSDLHSLNPENFFGKRTEANSTNSSIEIVSCSGYSESWLSIQEEEEVETSHKKQIQRKQKKLWHFIHRDGNYLVNKQQASREISWHYLSGEFV